MDDKTTKPKPTTSSGVLAVFVVGIFAGLFSAGLAGDISKSGSWIDENPWLFGGIVGGVVIHLLLLALIARGIFTDDSGKHLKPLWADSPDDPPAQP